MSTAATTARCSARLDGPSGYLWLEGNGKITVRNGTLDHPKPNAFSVLAVQDCPGSTATCRASCYVQAVAEHASDTYLQYAHNSAMIRSILTSDEATVWVGLMAGWIRKNCEGGFRWHVSGDVFSDEYAQWIVDVCRGSAEIPHWIYTRSFEFVPALYKVATVNGGNLALNISADVDNWTGAERTAKRHGLRICYLSTTGSVPSRLEIGDVIFPDYTFRSSGEGGAAWFAALPPMQKKMVCPVDYHGKSELRRCGPCDRCLF